MHLLGSSGEEVQSRRVPLRLVLMYENMHKVHNQEILKLSPDSKLVIDEHGKATLRVRIEEVSKNHQKQVCNSEAATFAGIFCILTVAGVVSLIMWWPSPTQAAQSNFDFVVCLPIMLLAIILFDRFPGVPHQGRARCAGTAHVHGHQLRREQAHHGAVEAHQQAQEQAYVHRHNGR